MHNECIFIEDISKLIITKVKPWKIYFKYDNTEYMIIDSGEPGEQSLSLYERTKLSNGNHKVKLLNKAITTTKPYDLIRDVSKKAPDNIVYANVDRNWFIIQLIDLNFSRGYLEERQAKCNSAQYELDDEIRKLQEKLNKLQDKKKELHKDKYTIQKLGSKEARGRRIKTEMAERVHGKHDGEWCEEYNAFYGEADPTYGGRLIDLYNLPVGTYFSVANGAWDGVIAYDEHGDKGILNCVNFIRLNKDCHSLYLNSINGERIYGR